MAIVAVVQDRLIVLAQKSLPGHADRDDRRAQLPADVGVRVGNGLLRFGRVASCPGHVKNRL